MGHVEKTIDPVQLLLVDASYFVEEDHSVLLSLLDVSSLVKNRSAGW